MIEPRPGLVGRSNVGGRSAYEAVDRRFSFLCRCEAVAFAPLSAQSVFCYNCHVIFPKVSLRLMCSDCLEPLPCNRSNSVYLCSRGVPLPITVPMLVVHCHHCSSQHLFSNLALHCRLCRCKFPCGCAPSAHDSRTRLFAQQSEAAHAPAMYSREPDLDQNYRDSGDETSSLLGDLDHMCSESQSKLMKKTSFIRKSNIYVVSIELILIPISISCVD